MNHCFVCHAFSLERFGPVYAVLNLKLVQRLCLVLRDLNAVMIPAVDNAVAGLGLKDAAVGRIVIGRDETGRAEVTVLCHPDALGRLLDIQNIVSKISSLYTPGFPVFV